jgi:tRNA threonylcarbamoyladenosine biosynthesis protein TsaB
MVQARLLHLETSTTVCSVALSQGNEIIGLSEIDEANVHASQLTCRVDQLMEKEGWTYADLDAVVVSKGPGSYTGLRIGVSTAKGLCYALDKPLIALDSLQSLAAGYLQRDGQPGLDDRLVPMIDARRMEVYASHWDLNGRRLSPTEAIILEEETFDAWKEKGTCFLFGSGADKLVELYQHQEHIQIVTGFKASASYMVGLGYEAFIAKQFEDLAYFEPYYLKEFVPTQPRKRV